jgi:hypothetical protein
VERLENPALLDAMNQFGSRRVAVDFLRERVTADEADGNLYDAFAIVVIATSIISVAITSRWTCARTDGLASRSPLARLPMSYRTAQ